MDRRQVLGILLIVLVLIGGRTVRRHMLLDVDGRWRDELWLDHLLPATAADAEAAEKKVVLTDPLPINTCSVDSLTLLPGVGPVIAGRIDEVRQMGIIFRIPDDLKQVKGIGPALSARLSPLVIFAIDSTAAPADTLARTGS